MRELHYIDGVLVVDDAVCLAVFEYAVALAGHGSADLITIPILWEQSRQTSNIVLGPASQLYCTPTSGDPGDIDLTDAGLVEELSRRARRIGPRSAVPMASDADIPPSDAYDI